MDKAWKIIKEIQTSLTTTSVNSLNEKWIQDLSESTEVPIDYINETVYRMLKMFLLNEHSEHLNYVDLIGRHRHISDEEFDSSELKKGIEIEKEHINDLIINEELGIFLAKEIAKDHLSEIPDYYTRLIKMEKDAGVLNDKEKVSEGSLIDDIKGHIKGEIPVAEGIKILVVDDEILKS